MAGGRRTGPSGTACRSASRWCRDGSLAFVSDVGGWWQPWRCWPGDDAVRLCAEEAEFHGPDWALGQATMADGRRRAGLPLAPRGHRPLGLLDRLGPFEVLAQPCVSVGGLCAAHGRAWPGSGHPHRSGRPVVGPGPGRPGSVTRRWPWCPGPAVAGASDVSVADRSPSRPPGATRCTGSSTHPCWTVCVVPTGHGRRWWCCATAGPTGSPRPGSTRSSSSSPRRGFAVAAVDYARQHRLRPGLPPSGSTAAGARPTRTTARPRPGGWPSAGRVDGARMAIRGGSAGGLTALNALVRSDAVRRRGVLVRGDRPAAAGRDHPRLRVPLHGPAGRPAARGRRRVPRGARRSTGSTT